jgi:hypothetical protein
MRAGAVPDMYFRTAVHEIGHAMGLDHNNKDNGIMNATDTIAANSLKPGSPPFPKNIQWSFAPDDELRLRHWPDIVVRPGGTPWNNNVGAPLAVLQSRQHRLELSPVVKSVPIGAPVRIDLSLFNATDQTIFAPASVSLKSGFVRGRVIDPSGTLRTFAALAVSEDEHNLQALEPGGGPVTDSLTLCRGQQGALFPAPGPYRVIVDVFWPLADMVEIVVTGATDVMVTAAKDTAHAEAALKVFSTPDTLLTLVLGGDHLAEGIAAIQTALRNPVLRPHFAFIEAKRLAQRFGQRAPDLAAAAGLIDETAVMSRAEVRKAAQLAKDGNDGSRVIAEALKAKIARQNVDEDTGNLVRAL